MPVFKRQTVAYDLLNKTVFFVFSWCLSLGVVMEQQAPWSP